MALERNAYKALGSVVGAENISEDPAVLLGYAFSGMIFGFDPSQVSKFIPFGPEAVVLPKNTEEVQGIIQVCNRYNVKFKAHSTGYGGAGNPGVEGVVVVDLRRMNRIIEIDEKNRCAVIEPYVTAAQLQAETMKRGLNCHVVSAGGNHSPLASATSMMGISTTGLATSQNARNLFGAEWVLPTGEILRLGSPGSGAGWFSGDGPGPSMRGIMRGYVGASGGLGIFTRIGFKLYPWTGPAELKRTGAHPQIGWEVPENFKYCYPYWESWEDVTEAIYKITEAGVAFILNRVPPDWTGWILTRTNTEFYRLYKEEALPVLRKHGMGCNVIIAARRELEFAYKMKVLEKIVADTNGKFLTLTTEQEEVLFAACLSNDYVPRGMRPTGSFTTSFGHYESIGLMKKVIEAGEACLGDNIKPGGQFTECGPEGFWSWPTEGRHFWQENAFPYDQFDSDSRKATFEYFVKTLDVTVKAKGGLGLMPFLMGTIPLELLGPALSNCHDWMRKIKNTFDPQNSSDHSGYISPESTK